MSTEESIYTESKQVLDTAECLHDTAVVEQAITRMANEITQKLQLDNPLLLPVMTGGVVLAGKLIPQLRFPLQVDYIHATRYRSTTSGHDISWLKKPEKSLKGKAVLLIDDILDEGITLAAIVEHCRNEGASAVYTAVLVEKLLDKPKPLEKADFTGLSVPNRYVFGYGMDYKEYHRNVSGIYAVKES
ncbi:MAG: hypoxanthine-guanine phosphoribosyltransferase [Gammaproteobacteria bacterium]